MFELKPLSKSAVPAALAKAERYRLLNEPMQAASICEDVLRVEPDNDDAILRWNACARVLMRNPHLQSRAEERDMPLALE